MGGYKHSLGTSTLTIFQGRTTHRPLDILTANHYRLKPHLSTGEAQEGTEERRKAWWRRMFGG
jgi:hypothetical protein